MPGEDGKIMLRRERPFSCPYPEAHHHIGDRTFNGTSKITPEQLDLFESLNLSKPA